MRLLPLISSLGTLLRAWHSHPLLDRCLGCIWSSGSPGKSEGLSFVGTLGVEEVMLARGLQSHSLFPPFISHPRSLKQPHGGVLIGDSGC
jgi:hypothetical protein